MADNVFDVVLDAIQSQKLSTERRLDLLKAFQGNINRQSSVITGLADKLLGSVKNLLGQFSNSSGYSDTQVRGQLETALEASLSNSSGAEALNASTDQVMASVQEAVNGFHASLMVDPANAFVLPRVTYDNMAISNVSRAEALNEAAETVGLIKLMHDAIPPAYYDALSTEVLAVAQPQLEETVRNLIIACGSVAAGNDPEELLATIENDFEATIRLIARESVFDSSQFSPAEYLQLVQRLQAAADTIEETSVVMEASKQNMLDFQTNFLAEYGSPFAECGTLESARSTIQGVVDRIGVLQGPGLQQAETLSIEATREIVLDLSIALTLIQNFSRPAAAFEDVLQVAPSTERSLFEASQSALSAVPALSTTLAGNLRTFARLAEQRLTSPTVSAQVGTLYTSISGELPVEFANSEAIQAALNSYSIDVSTPTRSLIVNSLRDVRDLGLDRMLDAILTGDLTIAFDSNTTRAARVGFAIQEVALALEGAISGVSLALGGCKVSERFSQRRLSTMLAELQEQFHVRVFSQLSFRDFLQRRVRDLQDRKLKRLCRFIEEVGTISLAEGCE